MRSKEAEGAFVESKNEHEKEVTSVRAQYEQKMCLVISELKRKSCAATSGDDRQSAVADEHVTELQEKLTQTLDSLREKARFSTILN